MKKAIILIWAIVVLLCVAYAIVVTNAPVKALHQLQNQLREEKKIDPEKEAVLQLSELNELLKEKASKEAHLELASADSIGLFINLNDSSASLMLKGMQLHPSKVIQYKYDRFFKSFDQASAYALYSKPLNIVSQESNVEKRPFIHKIAPKDTSEVSSEISYTDTTKNVAISLKLTTDYGFQILLLAHDDDFSKRKHNNKELMKEKVNSFKNNIVAIVKRKPIPYSPSIKIYLKSQDIVNIYRALPNSAQVVVAFPEQ